LVSFSYLGDLDVNILPSALRLVSGYRKRKKKIYSDKTPVELLKIPLTYKKQIPLRVFSKCLAEKRSPLSPMMGIGVIPSAAGVSFEIRGFIASSRRNRITLELSAHIDNHFKS
jgi:hypothetical protein